MLLAANELSMRQVIAYEPVMKPFSQSALPALEAAAAAADWSRSVEIALRQVACVSAEDVDYLRSNPQIWDQLCRLSMPSYAELLAVNTRPQPDQITRLADRVNLIIVTGEVLDPMSVEQAMRGAVTPCWFRMCAALETPTNPSEQTAMTPGHLRKNFVL